MAEPITHCPKCGADEIEATVPAYLTLTIRQIAEPGPNDGCYEIVDFEWDAGGPAPDPTLAALAFEHQHCHVYCPNGCNLDDLVVSVDIAGTFWHDET